MKKANTIPLAALAAVCLAALAGCSSGSSDSDPTASIVKAWTWVSGSSSRNASGVYNGTAVPGARGFSVSWIDSAGDLWLFGGVGYDSSGSFDALNDLWKYDVSEDNWSWVSGSDTINASGVYSGTAVPGARSYSVSWIDSAGDLWLFGGWGYDSLVSNVYLNDLWKYDVSADSWSFVSGSSSIGAWGVYSDTAVPGARYSSVNWIDSAGDLWLFGGRGCNSVGSDGNLNDLWKYDVSENSWSYVSGSSSIGASGTYSGTAVPGARNASVSWIDSAGDLWFFGGYGYDSSGSEGNLNDLWKYDVSEGSWSFVSGSSSINASGVYSGTVVPGARYGSISWIDSAGDLWFFGGWGCDSLGSEGDLNDLWKYGEQ